ncbi:MAG: helix-turn-helix domain-containing protein [Clostridia bacterium]|nr:helix-turn-helix domain-containing protein [Clostridia bacterium]
MDYCCLGKRIRSIRQNLNMTQAELAERINVTPAYIGQIERGERKFTIETLVDIANTLMVSVDFLLRDSMSNNKNSLIGELMSLLEKKDEKELFISLSMLKSFFEHMDKYGKDSK